MKTLTSFLIITSFAITGVSYADAVRPQSVSPAVSATTAVFVSGSGVRGGSVAGHTALKAVSHDNGHGQQVLLFVK